MSRLATLGSFDDARARQRRTALVRLGASTAGSAAMVAWKAIALMVAPSTLLLASIVAALGLTAIKGCTVATMRRATRHPDGRGRPVRQARRAGAVIIVASLAFLLAALDGSGLGVRSHLPEAILLSLAVVIELVSACIGLARDRGTHAPLRHVRLASLAVGIMLLALVQSALVSATGGDGSAIVPSLGATTAVAGLAIGVSLLRRRTSVPDAVPSSIRSTPTRPSDERCQQRQRQGRSASVVRAEDDVERGGVARDDRGSVVAEQRLVVDEPQHGHEAMHLSGEEPGAQLCLGTLEPSRDRSDELLLHALREPRSDRWAVRGSDERGEDLAPSPRRIGVEQRRDDGDSELLERRLHQIPPLVVLLNDLEEQRFLGAEVILHERGISSRCGGDVAHRRVREAALGEQSRRGTEDRGPRGASAQGPAVGRGVSELHLDLPWIASERGDSLDSTAAIFYGVELNGVEVGATNRRTADDTR